MRTILEIYFGINLLAAGHELGEGGNLRDAILCVFLGCIFAVYWTLRVDVFLLWLDKVTNIRFYWFYFLTKRFYNLSQKELKDNNFVSKKYHSSNSLIDKHWRFGIKLINKRNNYIPE